MHRKNSTDWVGRSSLWTPVSSSCKMRIIVLFEAIGRRLRDNVCVYGLLGSWHELVLEVAKGFLLLRSFVSFLFSGCFCGFSFIMALGIKCLRLLHPAFCTYLTTLTRPASEISMKPVHGRQHDQRQYLAYPAMPVRQFATKKAKGRWPPSSQPFLAFKRSQRFVEPRACFVTIIPHLFLVGS